LADGSATDRDQTPLVVQGLDFLGGEKLEEGIGLCLSGGGFRAMLFHLGSLIRLNELGLLTRLERIASVSGDRWLLAFWPLNGKILNSTIEAPNAAEGCHSSTSGRKSHANPVQRQTIAHGRRCLRQLRPRTGLETLQDDSRQ